MMNTATDVAVLIDSSPTPFAEAYGATYSLIEVWRLQDPDGVYLQKVRVDIRVASDPVFCHAIIEVLISGPDFRWTSVASEPAVTWFPIVASAFPGEAPGDVDAVRQELAFLVNKLVTRAYAILH